jgi:hypothetical protein
MKSENFMRGSFLFGSQLQIQGAKKMKMTEQQKADYKLYRKECKFSGVEPVRKDFLAGDIPSCVTFHMELTRKMGQHERAMGVAA